MGGRGASSGGGGGGGGKAANTPKGNALALDTSNLPDDVKKKLGTQGDPVGIRDSCAVTNPNFTKGKQWRTNCQRVVYANELVRRGYDVTANPNPGSDGFNSYNGGWRRVFVGQQWTNHGELGTRTKTVEKNIQGKMSGWGDGSRAVVCVAWKGANSGHVFNVEQRNGKTIAYDAQSGKKVSLNHYLSMAKPSYTQISRIDNLTVPTHNLAKCFRQKGS